MLLAFSRRAAAEMQRRVERITAEAATTAAIQRSAQQPAAPRRSRRGGEIGSRRRSGRPDGKPAPLGALEPAAGGHCDKSMKSVRFGSRYDSALAAGRLHSIAPAGRGSAETCREKANALVHEHRPSGVDSTTLAAACTGHLPGGVQSCLCGSLGRSTAGRGRAPDRLGCGKAFLREAGRQLGQAVSAGEP